MGVDKGYLNLGAFKKQSVFATPVACGAGDGFEFLSEDLAADVQMIEDASLTGKAGQRQATAGSRLYAGSITFPLRYEGLEPIIAQAFGTAGAPTTVDTTAKKHALRMADTVEGIFGTLALSKAGIAEVHEFTGAKVLGFTLRARAGARAELVVRFACHDHAINTASGTNNNTTFASVTLPANRHFADFGHLTIRANAQAGGALDAAAELFGVIGFEVNFDRQHKVDDVTTRYKTKIDEPTPSGFAVVTGSLELSKYESGTGGGSTLYPLTLSKDLQKMDARFVGAVLAGSATQFYEWDLSFPAVQFGSARPQTSGPGVAGWTIPFSAWRVPTAPTGMTAMTEALNLDIYSQRAADPLA